MRNVARCWCYETGRLLGQELPDECAPHFLDSFQTKTQCKTYNLVRAPSRKEGLPPGVSIVHRQEFEPACAHNVLVVCCWRLCATIWGGASTFIILSRGECLYKLSRWMGDFCDRHMRGRLSRQQMLVSRCWSGCLGCLIIFVDSAKPMHCAKKIRCGSSLAFLTKCRVLQSLKDQSGTVKKEGILKCCRGMRAGCRRGVCGMPH